MKIILNDIKYLKEPISIIAEILKDVNINIEKDKLTIFALDPAQVCMVNFKLLNPVFSVYEVEEPVKIGISLEHLNAILKRCQSGDKMTMELNKNRLKIIVESENFKKYFTLSLLDIEEEKTKTPNLKYNTKIKMENAKFKEVIEDSSICSDVVRFTLDKNKFEINSEGNLIKMNADVLADLEGESEKKISSRYSLEYLNKIIKAGNLTDSVLIKFNNNYPLTLDYLLIDKFLLEFVLAPRVSED